MEYIPDRSLPVSVQVRNALEILLGLQPATGTIAFTGLPTAAETLTISDGVNTEVYTFVDALSGAANEVLIGASRDLTMAALLASINLNAPATEIDRLVGIDATLVVVVGADNDSITLVNTLAGTAGNVAISTDSAVVSVTGMSGGTDGSNALPVSGITFDKDIDIGDIHLLNTSNAKVNPATSDLQTTINAKIPALGQALAAASMPVVLPSIQQAAMATSAKQDTLIAKDFATQTTLAAVLAKLIAAPATEAKQDSILSAVQASAGSAVTFQTPISISQGSAGRITLLALEASKIIRLHELRVSADAAGTYYIAYDDDGAGTNEVALTGAFPVGTNGANPIPWRPDPDGCLKTAAGKQLTIVSSTSRLFGYAICSKHTL